MLEIEKGYEVNGVTLDWLEIEKIILFHEVALMQKSAKEQCPELTDKKALEIAENAMDLLKTLGIAEQDALSMVLSASCSS